MSALEYSLFLLKKIIAVGALPPLAPLLLVGLGLALGKRGRVLAWLGLLLAVLLSTPAVVGLLAAPLQDVPVTNLEAARGAQAIVILGSGRNLAAPEYGGETISRLSLERVRYGARIARETGLPVLVTGGAPSKVGASEAVLMRDAMERDFNVPVRWLEAESLDTRDNARLSAKILREAGVQRVVVVTHALHMKRALGEFSAAGLTPIAAPTGRYGGTGDEVLHWLPSANGAYFGWFVCHEWLGLLAQRMRP